MLKPVAFAALLVVAFLAPTGVSRAVDGQGELIDLPSAYTMLRGEYSLGLRVVPDGGLLAGLRVGVTPYLQVGVSYGAGNVVGSGEPYWDDGVEFDFKVQLAEERDPIPGLAFGYDSRGYGRQLDDGGYEKASLGLYLSASKTLPFSEYWQLHAGISRTLEEEKVKPDLFAGASARFSQEFSVVVEYHHAVDRRNDSSEDKIGLLNAGLRWVFSGQLELDLYFRNLVGPAGSPELSSRSIAFVFYDSF